MSEADIHVVGDWPSWGIGVRRGRLEVPGRTVPVLLRAVDEPVVPALVEHLAARGATLGVLTRNALELAHLTLETVGLAPFFERDAVLGRECAAPKPSPEGVLRLLSHWNARPDDAVMVGDYLFDLEAGRAAGAATILIDRDGHGQWYTSAECAVRSLDTLISPLK